MKKTKVFNYKSLSFICIVLIVAMAVIGAFQVKSYDESIMDIYAGQQDSYVQLVVDQINIQDDRSDDELITDILQTLDDSNNKYWTLSKEHAILYVKNVVETNRYKGFTTATFYVSDSASKFLEELTLNHVRHKMIDIDNREYMASGVIFEYNGVEYKICLLTDKSVILDNNNYLFSKISMFIYVGSILIILLIVTMLLTNLLDVKGKKINSYLSKIEEQNRNIEVLEEKIKGLNNYHTRWSLFNNNTMESFVIKLADRKVSPVVFMRINFADKESFSGFLGKAQLLLDKKVIRFSAKKGKIELIFVQYSKEQAINAVNTINQNGVNIECTLSFEDESMGLFETYKTFKETDNE